MTPGHAEYAAPSCRIESPGEGHALEFKTFLFPLVGTATADLPAPPGAAWRDGAGHATLLHFAPGRFLAPAPTAEIARHLAALEATGVGRLFDVDGKWRALTVAGPGAARLLSAGADAEAVLAHRDCAALTLLDCPVVLARVGEGFDLWVQASYATDLRASLERLSGR
jgi:heterotetrameric sarcosine oxidase gamma subunit